MRPKKLSFIDEVDSRRSSLSLSDERPKSSHRLPHLGKSSQKLHLEKGYPKLPQLERSFSKFDLKKSLEKNSFNISKSVEKLGKLFDN